MLNRKQRATLILGCTLVAISYLFPSWDVTFTSREFPRDPYRVTVTSGGSHFIFSPPQPAKEDSADFQYRYQDGGWSWDARVNFKQMLIQISVIFLMTIGGISLFGTRKAFQ
jgi:hypothetical protein